jgi:hypothetical protein
MLLGGAIALSPAFGSAARILIDTTLPQELDFLYVDFVAVGQNYQPKGYSPSADTDCRSSKSWAPLGQKSIRSWWKTHVASWLATEQNGARRSYLNNMTYQKASRVGVDATPGSPAQNFRVEKERHEFDTTSGTISGYPGGGPVRAPRISV